MYDIVIVGSGCAGMTAAMYAGRAGYKPLLIEGEAVGGQIIYSARIENFPSVEAVDGATFSDRLFAQTQEFGAEFVSDVVTNVEPDGDFLKIVTEAGEYTGKTVILATGMKHRKLGLEREDELVGAGVSYCALCDGMFYQNETVGVVGGGNTALQDAIYLAKYCSKVYLIHRREEFRGDMKYVDELRAMPNVEFVLSAKPVRLLGNDALTGIEVEAAGALRRIDLSGLFIAVGSIPVNEKFAGLVALDADGFISAGEDCRTNRDGIFAAGDCRSKTVRQLTTAAADGAVAAMAAVDYLRSKHI